MFFINSIFLMAWKELRITDETTDETNIFNMLMRFQLTLSIIIIPLIKLIVLYLFGGEYYSAWKYSGLLILAATFYNFSGFVGAYYYKEKKTKNHFFTSIAGAFTNILINYLFLDKFGLQVASLLIKIDFKCMALLLSYAMFNIIIIFYLDIIGIIALTVVNIIIFIIFNKKIIEILIKKYSCKNNFFKKKRYENENKRVKTIK